MLVIISDLHLTDGTTGPSIAPQAFELFADQLRSMTESASWRTDGRYRPLERVDLLLLGDMLDLTRSSHWTQRNDVRPWDAIDRPALVELVTRVAGDILRHNQHSLETLRSLTDDGALAIPPADLRGRPVHDTPPMPVPLSIHYMVGEHDWFLHVNSPAYDNLRAMVIKHLGLAQKANAPFPHDIADDEMLLDTLRRYRLLARHGDIFDPLCYHGQRDTSSLADAIAIELLTPFASQIVIELKESLPRATAAGLVDLHHVRPLLMLPSWIESLLDRTCTQPQLCRRVKQIWNRMVDRMFELPVAQQYQAWHGADHTRDLRHAMRIGTSSHATSRAAALDMASQHGSFAAHALREPDYRNRRAKAIVYGHTHMAETVPLDASFADGFVLNQVYFNTGTWRRMMRPTMAAPGRCEFIGCEAMGLTAFFQGDERGGRPYETWSGTLGIRSTTGSVLRLDDSTPIAAPMATEAPGASRSSPIVAPHFATSPAARVVPTRRSL